MFALVIFEGVLFVVVVVSVEAYTGEKNSFYLLLLRS